MDTAEQQDVIEQARESGLYAADWEHDACGVGFVANIKGKASHALIQQALLILQNLDPAARWGPTRCAATARASWCRFQTRFTGKRWSNRA
jgi:hypothetical protein